jgi:hypothetical protein
MEDTARLFIVLIGFCFLIVFVVWIFIAFSIPVLFWTTQTKPCVSAAKVTWPGCVSKGTRVNRRI